MTIIQPVNDNSNERQLNNDTVCQSFTEDDHEGKTQQGWQQGYV